MDKNFGMDKKPGDLGLPPEYEPPKQAAPSQSTFASLSLHGGDKLRMQAFPREMHMAVAHVIARTWPGGIQRQQPYYSSYEIKLRGYPWTSTGSEAVTSRQLMSRILACLYENGWILSLSTDISKTVSDLDTLLFRHQNPPPAPCEWMAISFSRSDRMRFLWHPEQRKVHQKDEVINRFASTLGPILQQQGPHHLPGCWEIKLRGYPWNSTGGEAVGARDIILGLMSTIEQFGWTVYGSVDQKEQRGGENSSGDTDTWHLRRVIGWEVGMPVYQN